MRAWIAGRRCQTTESMQLMNANTIHTSTVRWLLRTLARLGVAALLIAAAAACGVTEPDESAWADVSQFSWPTTPGAYMRYRVEEREPGNATKASERTERVTDTSRLSNYNGRPMYMLYDDDLSPTLCTHFLPTRDTLITDRDPTQARYALVAPLVRGNSWIAAYRVVGADSVPSLQGRIIERYSQLKLDGHVYDNAVVVQYKPLDANRQDYWIRIFAEHIGAIQTIKYYPTQIDDDGLTALKSDDRFTKRTTLIESSTMN